MLLLALQAAYAQPAIIPEGQIRPRLELHTGRDAAPGGRRAFVTQRTRFGARFQTGPLLVRVVLQDVRNWGTELNTLTDFSADGFDAHFGYLQYKPLDSLTLTLGRQPLNLHEQRLIGAVEWTSQGRSFDGARVEWTEGIGHVEAVGALLGVPGDTRPDVQAMGYVRAGLGKGKQLADAVYIVDGNGDRILHTGGVYLKGGTVLSGRVEAYLQASPAGAAGLVGVRGTWSPKHVLKPTFTLWYDALTADGPNGEGAFQTLYATNHKFYGRADIAVFLRGGVSDGQGLQDAAVKFGLQPVKDLKLRLDAHGFWVGPGAKADRSVIGQEVDAWADYTVLKRCAKKRPGACSSLGISMGAAAFFSPDGPDGWGYFMIDSQL